MNYADRTKSKKQFQSNLWLAGQYFPCRPCRSRFPHRHRRLRRSSAARTASSATTRSALYHSGFWQPINSVDDPNANSNDRVNNVTNTWEVNEKLTTAFVKFGIDTELGGLPLRGNIGVQCDDGGPDLGSAPHEHGQSRATPRVAGYTSVTEGDKYTDVLPSLNLALEFPHEMKLRFGAAITVARPRLDELRRRLELHGDQRPGAPPNYNGTQYYWSRNGGGNPKLKPGRRTPSTCRSRNTSATRAYVSAGGLLQGPHDLHLQRIDRSKTSRTCRCRRCRRVIPPPTTQANANRLGVSTLKSNGCGGYIKGFELTAVDSVLACSRMRSTASASS